MSQRKSIKRQIVSLEHWKVAEQYLLINNYRVWQTQFHYDSPDGFHAWFWKPEESKDIEIITFSEDVQEAIMKMPS